MLYRTLMKVFASPEQTGRAVKARCSLYFSNAARRSDFHPTERDAIVPNKARWFSELQLRIEQSMGSHVPFNRREAARALLESTNKNWMGLLAGKEGFLTEQEWRGLNGHEVAWGDMRCSLTVLKGHVNNVKYNRYVESARVNWILHHGRDTSPEQESKWVELVTSRGLGVILQSIKTEFKFPMEFPDRVSVVYKLLEPPTHDSTELHLEAWVLSEKYRRVAAKCVDKVAIYDYKVSKKAALQPFMVDKFKETFEAQNKCKQRYDAEIRSLFTAIAHIEQLV
ncbi:hypothetical protein G7046_g5569 [Stylonectria norvegica]|nr:hypothetical protein G7046_g5569 [Stylonectria norvegica]